MEPHNQLNNINVFAISLNQMLQLVWHISGNLKFQIKMLINIYKIQIVNLNTSTGLTYTLYDFKNNFNYSLY